MNERQYLACKFRPGDKRAYTYHNDGDPCAVGDKVLVASPRGEGRMTVEVAVILDANPGFATKAIIGKAPPPEGKLV